MTETGPPTTATTAQSTVRLNLAYHAIIGAAMGVIAPFTGFAWIPAILTGMVIGRAGVEQRQGIKSSRATQAVRVLAVTGGVLAMMVLGAILGGIIAFLIAALAGFSERLAEGTTATDQTIARILISIMALGVWLVLLLVLNMDVSIRIG